MSDFKQQVEEAIKDAIHDALPEEIIDLTDRILAAHNAELDRIAEGLPVIDEYTTKKCQAHVKGQKV